MNETGFRIKIGRTKICVQRGAGRTVAVVTGAGIVAPCGPAQDPVRGALKVVEVEDRLERGSLGPGPFDPSFVGRRLALGGEKLVDGGWVE